MYRDAIDDLDDAQKKNLCNLCVINLKKKDWAQLIKYANDALEVDHKYPKSLFMKAKGLIETSEYQQAIEVLEFLMEVDPTHEEGKQELLRA